MPTRFLRMVALLATSLVLPSVTDATPRSLPTRGTFFSSNQRYFLQVEENRPFKVFDRQNPKVPVWEITHKHAFNTHYLVSDDGETIVDLTLWNAQRQVEQDPSLEAVCMTFIQHQGVVRTRTVQEFFFHASNANPRQFVFFPQHWFREPIVRDDVFSFVTDEDRQFDVSIKTGDTLREAQPPFDRLSRPTRARFAVLKYGACAAALLTLGLYLLLRRKHRLM